MDANAMDAIEAETVQLLESVSVNGKECTVIINRDNISFQSPNKNVKNLGPIPLERVLAAKLCETVGKRASLKRKFSQKNGLEIPLPHSLKVYSSTVSKSGKWKICKHSIVCSTQQQSQNLVEAINAEIKGRAELRPKHLMVIVNPKGGRRKGTKIYNKHAAHVFSLLDIKTDVFVTKHQDEARELVLERDLSAYDGIVGVGGDGTIHEIVNALLIRTQKAADLDLDDPDTKLLRPKLKIGIIPAGSTDAIVFDTVGVSDPLTSALQIAQGFSVGLDVCSVHHNDYLLRYTLAFLGYGFFGDVVKESENYRWMGPNRYGLAGFLKYVGNRSYHGVVSYLPNDDHSHSPWDDEGCRVGCPVCRDKGNVSSHPGVAAEERVLHTDGHTARLKDSSQWELRHGEFNAINAAILSCTSNKAPRGVSPAAHLGNGCVDLILVRRCSRLQYLRYMLRLALRGNPLTLSYVEVHRVKAFKFQTMPPHHHVEEGSDAAAASGDSDYIPRRQPSVSSTSSWNLDGEISDQADIDVRVHCQLIQLFALGPDSPGDKSALACFH